MLEEGEGSRGKCTSREEEESQNRRTDAASGGGEEQGLICIDPDAPV